jgi:glycosyltransferase involved in cell wall biosynthesis
MLPELARYARGALRGAAQPAQRRPDGAPARLRFCYPELGAPSRYRVQHQVEQARLAGLQAEAVAITQPEQLYDLAGSDLLYLYRTPLAPRSMLLLALARMRRIPVLFDSDDLVWDTRLRQFEALDQHYDRATVQRILRTVRGMAAMMRRVDGLVLSTPYLAEQAAAVCDRPRYVNLNAVSAEMARLSDEAFQRRSPGRQVVIAYFSGHAHVHDEDLASVAAPLRTVLGRFPAALLRLCGDVALPAELADHAAAGRVERRPLVDWRELPGLIAEADISIAPLIDNPQRRSKSAVKYLEAALVGVPTVASRMEPYAAVLREGQHALLAATPAEWVAALSMLVESRLMRDQIGLRARAHTLAEHTTAARAPAFTQLIGRALEGR